MFIYQPKTFGDYRELLKRFRDSGFVFETLYNNDNDITFIGCLTGFEYIVEFPQGLNWY